MAVDYFLKIDGIPGDSTDAKHPGEIEVESWSWGETNLVGSTSNVAMQDFNFVARTSIASPLLFLRCADGAQVGKAMLTSRRSGEQPFEFLRWTLDNVVVTSYQSGASAAGDAAPVDQFSLNFSRITVSYTTQTATGGAGTTLTKGWDRTKNTAF